MAVRTIKRSRRTPPLHAVPTPADLAATLSARDAVARADAITAVPEAVALMRLALASGDEDLAAAVEARALSEVRHGRPARGWAQVLELRGTAHGDPRDAA